MAVPTDATTNPCGSPSVVEQSQLEDVINALMHFADQGDSRGALNQERNSAKERLKEQVEETHNMYSAMKGFPTHLEVQNQRKIEAEKALETTEKELEKAKRLQRDAAKAIASRLIIKTAPTTDNSKLLQERCQSLEVKVKDLEKTIACMNHKDSERRFRDIEADHREVISKIGKSESQIVGKIYNSEAKAMRECQNLSEKYTKLDQQHQATRSELASMTSRLDSYGNSIKKLEASIKISKEEMTTSQHHVNKEFATLKANNDDSIHQLAEKVVDLEKSFGTYKNSLECLSSSNMERLGRLENDKTSVVVLLNAHKAILEKVENFQVVLNTLQDKVIRLEHIPQTSSISAPQATSKALTGSSATMIGVVHTGLRDVKQDVKLAEERLDKIEALLRSTSRTSSQEAALIKGWQNSTTLNYESRLTALEESFKNMDSINVNEAVAKLSPFSTAAQDVADFKRAFETYRHERSQVDQAINQRVEKFGAEIQSLQKSNTVMEEQIKIITGKTESIPALQAGLDELLKNINALAQSSTLMDNQLNILTNNQNGNTIAITHLSSRMNNISTGDLAKSMMGQLEVLYPDLKNAERIISDLRMQQSDHTIQLEKLNSRMIDFESQTTRKQSPAAIGNPGTESLRQEVDALTKDQLNLEKSVTTYHSGLAALRKDLKALNDAVKDLDGQAEEQKKTLDGMRDELVEEVADLSVRVDDLYSSRNNNTRGFADNSSTPEPSASALVLRSSTVEIGLNGKKRKYVTAAASSEHGASINGHTRSPSRKKKRAEDDNEDIERLE
ncbi:hypothetical protein SS1G_02100 [Sclerotinia sclerotiorum 1980 UF-70]|uniref:Uncharacterized protein n=2 Tax=Sclerotinia sclerotiorum (strain ATCC 18683 / 1980 / Ss-1) TaxID=665079 RepID=A0A1D9PSF7_SCLS1|nr:hypothetical protein SS1G_02100 [Sclerotinia sclerotiorum 1980 UF-70]APA05586.1 hypothetical protein sscle_01g003560 [Sclerotinia sclerotiorum 1980 UF-70]EDN97172.1 hypothetical protein SS1G_02100 [Sclerotinia sclerotiorum 1980 UF-70]